MIILAIRFFEPLFGALIVMLFFGLPRCLHCFKLFFIPYSSFVAEKIIVVDAIPGIAYGILRIEALIVMKLFHKVRETVHI